MAAETMKAPPELAIALMLALQAWPALSATRPDTLIDNVEAPIEVRPGYAVPAPAPAPAPAAQRPHELTRNPLWAIPLTTLTATRDRPLFAPSRRPPAPVLPNAPVAAVAETPEAPRPASELRVTLILIGTVANETDGMALFTDPNSREIVRLRLGDVVAGWTLDAVRNREVTFRKGDRDDILTMQADLPASVATPVAPPSTDFVPNRPNGEVYN